MKRMFDENEIKDIAVEQVEGNYIPIKDFASGPFQIPQVGYNKDLYWIVCDINPNPSAIAQRTDTGTLRAAAPTQDDECVTKGSLKTLFGNKSIVGKGTINLYKHSIKGTFGNTTFYLRLYSSKNLQVSSLIDLKTLLGDTFEESATGSNGIIAVTNEKILFSDGTNAKWSGYKITDTVTAI